MLSALVALVFCSQGCKKNEQPPAPAPAAQPAPVKKPDKPVQKQLSSSLKLNPASHNQFDFSTKKDPFKPFLVARKPPLPLPGKVKRNTRFALPIHSFDVNQFRLIGVIIAGRENQAMVTDPNGKGYVIKVGMTIGKNDGRIISITNSGVTVLEQFRDDNGRVRKEYIKINLPRKQ